MLDFFLIFKSKKKKPLAKSTQFAAIYFIMTSYG